MISNIYRYASLRGISRQDSLQVFLQMIALKNLQIKNIRLIGGTSLVIGYNNPRFSEDIDLTGVEKSSNIKSGLEKAEREIAGLLNAEVSLKAPKEGQNTWRIACQTEDGLKATVHIDTQPYRALTNHPLIVEYPGIAPFVFAGVDVGEIMADKLIATAFRNNVSARDIFDLWYHWLKEGTDSNLNQTILEYVGQKLILRGLDQNDFLDKIKSRLENGITKRIEMEWERYLPGGFKEQELYGQIFSQVKCFLSGLVL